MVVFTQRINTHPAGWESLLPGIFDFVHDKLEEMGLDVLNWHLRSIAPWLAQHGVSSDPTPTLGYDGVSFPLLLTGDRQTTGASLKLPRHLRVTTFRHLKLLRIPQGPG